MNSNLSLESFKTYTLLHMILFLYSFGSVFSKLASRLSFGTFEFFIYYGIVIFILGIYALLWQQILKKVSITTAFANKAVVVIWGMFWGKLIFKEDISFNMIIGAIIIFIGILMVVSEDE